MYKILVVLFFVCPQEINRAHPVLGADNDKKELQLVVTEVGEARKASKVNNPCFRSFMMVRANSRGRTHMHRWMNADACRGARGVLCSGKHWSVATREAKGNGDLKKHKPPPEHRFAHARPYPKAAAYPIEFFCSFLSFFNQKKRGEPNECHRLGGTHRWGRGGTARDLACFLGQLFPRLLVRPRSLPRFTVAGAAGVQDRQGSIMTRLPFSVSPTATNSGNGKKQRRSISLL